MATCLGILQLAQPQKGIVAALEITFVILINNYIWRHSKFRDVKGINVLELSPKKTDYLKFIKEKKIAKTTEISNEFKVDPSTTTKILLELAKTDLITYTPYHGCSLTEKIQICRILKQAAWTYSVYASRYGNGRKNCLRSCWKIRIFCHERCGGHIVQEFLSPRP